MTVHRVILCLENPSVLHDELVASAVRRLKQFIELLSNQPQLHILYTEAAASDAQKMADAMQTAGTVQMTSYSGAIVPALQGCVAEDEVAAILPGIQPFLDIEEVRQMLDRHLRFRTHYSYSDTAVPGFFFDLLSGDIFADLGAEGREQPTIEALRGYCFRNIQDIDLDLHYADPDLRAFRLRLDCRDERSADRALRVLRKYPDLVHRQLMTVVENEADLPGIQPSYVEIELTTKQAVKPTVYPVSKEEISLDEAGVAGIMQGLQSFPLRDDVTVCLGGRGDPFEYTGLDDFVAALSDIPSVKDLYIETPGVGLTRSRIESLLAAWKRHPSLLTLIVRLPSLKAGMYRRWMGVDRIDDVLSLLDSIDSDALPCAVYAEMIRLPENEDELDGFLKRFPGKGVHPVIGKYSRFAGQLPALDVVDLSPLQRDYCRHLAFDLFINAKGEVPVCRQVLEGGPPVQDLLSLFLSRRNLHQAWMKADYKLSACSQCDDWYFFNA